jgi:Trypsin-co-occurring domain 1
MVEVAVKRLVEYRLGANGEKTLIVEADEPVEESGEERAAFASWKRPPSAPEQLESSLDRITPAADLLLSKLRELANRPDEATIEFGVKLTGHAGAVLASAGVEANFNVSLTWRRNREAAAVG